jgi:hypothetical protein
MSDPLDTLAVQVAEDHKATKRRGAKKPDAEPANPTPVEGEGSAELRVAVAELGDTVAAAEDQESALALRIEKTAESAVLDTRTLVGDIRDALLEIFKTRPKPWSQYLEDEQRQIAAALEQAARDLVNGAVQLINEDADEGFTAKLEQYTDKGGLKIALTAEATTDNVIACHRAQGQYVKILRVDPKPYSSARRDPAIDPDAPEMTFGNAPVKDETPPPPADDSDLNPFGDHDRDRDDDLGGDDLENDQD